MRILLLSNLGTLALAFQPTLNVTPRRRRIGFRHYHCILNTSPKTLLSAEKDGQEPKDALVPASPVEKAAWYAVETFGKEFGGKSGSQKVDKNEKNVSNILIGPPVSLAETKQRLKLDNDKSYFLSGQVDKEIYSIHCVFQDPFVSFEGRDRFVDNLQNLGSFITKYDARPIQYDESSLVVTTKFIVKLELNLPWKPILAWPWGVRCVIDPETNLIVRHEESWDIAPWDTRVLPVNNAVLADTDEKLFGGSRWGNHDNLREWIAENRNG